MPANILLSLRNNPPAELHIVVVVIWFPLKRIMEICGVIDASSIRYSVIDFRKKCVSRNRTAFAENMLTVCS